MLGLPPHFGAFAVISIAVLGLVATGCGQQQSATRGDSSKRQLERQVAQLKAQNRSLKRQLQVAKSTSDNVVSDNPYFDEDKEEIEDLREQLQKAKKAPVETGADDLYLDRGEWLQGLSTAQRLLIRSPEEKPARIVDMRKFVDYISEQPGVYWSQQEKAAFRSRYAAWYERNK